MNTDDTISRRTFSTLLGAGAALAPALLLGDAAFAAGAPAAGTFVPSATSAGEGDMLQSDFLMELVLEKGRPTEFAITSLLHDVIHSFYVPQFRVKADAVPGIVGRPDGSSVLDLRAVLQTDDEQKVSMTCRGIAYPTPGGPLHARILPLFETGSARYAWLNNVVAVGVLRPVPGKISYRVYEIL
jgi:hypothetical protein